MRFTDDKVKITFSSAIEELRAATFARLKPNRVREMTYTGPEPDGETPFLDAFERNPKDDYVVNLAHGIVNSWLSSPVIIYPEDLIVGVPRPQRILYEHFSWGLQYHPELFEHPAYASREADIKSRVEAQHDRMFPLDIEYIRSEGIRMFGSADVYDTLDGSLWWVGGYQGHTVPGYPLLLHEGLGGALDQIARSRKAHPESGKLYDALVIVLEGMGKWLECYADRADTLAEMDPKRAGKYRAIAENCRAVVSDAPRTLYQAVQLAWCYALWDWVDCIGRADQYFYSFYVRDDQDALFPREDIIQAFWLKGLEHGFHNITLAGVKANGDDACNELTYLMLQTARVLHETHPRVSVRWHEKTPDALMRLVTRMWAEGMSDPTIVSDLNILKGLSEIGIPLNDARDYTMLGCQEIEIPGKSNFGCEDGSLNLAKVLEYALNDGRDRFSGLQIGPHTGALCRFTSMKQIWQAFLTQMRFITERFITLCNRGVMIRSSNVSKLVKMAFTEDCVARGLNPDDKGPRYNPGVVETAGASAVADALTAIDLRVFREKTMTLETLDQALGADFAGYEDIRMILLTAPKFGNDDSLADEWACRVIDAFWSEIARYHSARGGVFTGACSLLEAGINYGQHTWALPDGRHTGEPLGNTIGPRTGADHSGLTAMLTSVAKLPLHKGVGGTTLNALLPQSLMQSDEMRERIKAAVTAYLSGGGQMLQVTTADRDEMIDAQVHPERHESLIVRIGGFSIRFVELACQTQNEVIARYA